MKEQMTINLTEILSLLAKADHLGIKYAVHEVVQNEHEIEFSIERFSHSGQVYIDTANLHIKESQIGQRSDFDTINQAMKYLYVMLDAIVRGKKRKVALDKLTDEEKELLGLK